MADEELATSTEQAPPAIEPIEAADETPTPELPKDIGDSGDAETPDEGENEDDLDDLEFAFGKYRVPKQLKTAVEELRTAFTQKTQEFSEKTKTLEAQAAQQVEASEAELDARAAIRSMDQRLDQYRTLTQADWDAHHEQDPMGTDKAWRDFQFLQERRAEAAKTLETATSERAQKAQQSFAKRVEETSAYAKTIPGWSPEVETETIKFALDKGVPQDFLRENISPKLYEIINLARLGEQAMQKQATAKPAPKPVEPLKMVTGRSTPAAAKTMAELADTDMDAFAKTLKLRMAKR